MNVAFLTPMLPWPANTGGTLRTYYLLRGLAARHTLDLICFHYGAQPALGPLATICANVYPISLGESYPRARQLRNLLWGQPQAVSYFTTASAQQQVARLLAAPYDLVIYDEVMMASYLPRPKQRFAPPRLLIRPKIDHQHYNEMAAERPWGITKLLNWREAQRLQRYERRILTHFQRVVVCSPEDRRITRTQSPTIAIEVIPNGADTDYYRPPALPEGSQLAHKPTILLLGTMHYYPNIDAVHYFFDDIYPPLRTRYPTLQVLIVGHQPPPAIRALGDQPGVTVTGSVRDIRPYLARSSLLAVPLRLGGGTRLKITEALAAGVPVVSTPIGAQGLVVKHEEHLLLAEEPAAFCAAIQRLLDDPPLGCRLAEAGRKLVESQYSWQTLGQHFANVCEATVGAAPAHQMTTDY